MAVATPSAGHAEGADRARSSAFPISSCKAGTASSRRRARPQPVVARLHQEIAAASKHPDVRKRMAEVGAEPSGSTPDEMRTMLRDQIAKVRPIVAELKLTME